MTRADLRQLVRHLVADPTGGHFDDTVINLFLQEAYRDLVTDLDGTVNGWGTHDTPATIDVVTDTREYDIVPTGGAASDVRKVTDITRLENTIEIPVDILSWNERNRGASVNLRPQVFYQRNAVYVFQTAAGTWRLGTIDQKTSPMTLYAYYQPKVPAFNNDGDEPAVIPAEYQSIIAYMCAISLKANEKRESSELMAIYQKKMTRLRAYLQFQVRPGAVRKI